MRLINADALKQTLKEDYVFYGFSELLDDFYKAIDDAPTIEPKQEWIPCEERLPEESGMYLCTCNDGYDNRTTFVKYQKRFSRWDLAGTRSYWEVIAWMPLPEPYQTKERSE